MVKIFKFKNIVTTMLSGIFLLPMLSLILRTDIKSWSQALHMQRIYESIGMTFYILILTIIFNILIGTPVAYTLSRTKSKLGKVLEILVFLPIIFPVTVSVLGVQYRFIQFGLIETTLGVAIVHTVMTLPYYILSMKSGYTTISDNYFKLGKVMGANEKQIFFKITLPMLKKSFIVGVAMIIIVSLVQYLTTFIIGGSEVMTLPIMLMPYMVDGGSKMGAVYSIIYILVTFISVVLAKSIINLLWRDRNVRSKN